MERRRVWVTLCTALLCGADLSAIAGPADTTPLVQRLVGADVKAAASAATALGESRSPVAEMALLDALVLGLPPEVAAAALDAVSRHPSDKALPVLLAYARNRNVGVRTHAVQALGALTGARAADEALLAALGDHEHAVRAAAARVLSWRKDVRAVPRLLLLLASGDDVAGPPLAALADADVADKVAGLTGKAPDDLLAQTLGAMARRRDLGVEAVHVAVVRALGAIPGDVALVELQKIADAPGVPKGARRDAQAFVEERRH